MMKSRVSVLPWGDGTVYVVHLDGCPVGRSVDLDRAIALALWLETAAGDLDEWAKARWLEAATADLDGWARAGTAGTTWAAVWVDPQAGCGYGRAG